MPFFACISTGFPQFPCVLVLMRYNIGENVCGQILKGENFGGKKVKKDEKMEKGG